MTHIVEKLPIGGETPGTERCLTVHRFGIPGARPKAYVQAGLHADELPGMLTAHHLLKSLIDLDARNGIKGEIVVVPSANPIGLAQSVWGYHVGRFALDGDGNFNRHYPDLVEAAASRLVGKLGDDADRNRAHVRGALAAALAERRPQSQTDRMRHILMALALDADLAIDLHCDLVAPVHVYTGSPLWPAAEDISREFGAAVTLLAEESGDNPFDEALSSPWWRLPRRLADDKPIAPGCLAATVELRGLHDVTDELASSDAAALVRVLMRRGVVDGDPGPLPPLRGPALDLAHNEMVRSPVAGIVVHKVRIGERVEKGVLIAEIVDPVAADPSGARTQIRSTTAGIVWSQRTNRLITAGGIVAKVAGSTPIEGRGPNLLTA